MAQAYGSGTGVGAAKQEVQTLSSTTCWSPAGEKGQAAANALLDAFSGVLAEALDAAGGDVDITDHAVFQQHARRYEAEFLRDMDDLGERRMSGR